MDERKELICTDGTERIDPFSLPGVAEGDVYTDDAVSTPRPPRRRFSGLAVGVALFAAAFMLCDGFYAVRAHAEASAELSGGRADWLSQLFSGGSVTAETGDDLPDATPNAPGGEASAPGEESAEGPELTGVPSETVGASEAPETAPPGLTREMLYTYNENAVPQGMIPIVPMDLSLSAYGESFHYNDTAYSPDLGSLKLSEDAVPTVAAAGEVSVLIVHTHATEGYSGEGALYYDPSTPLARADDPATGVIAVGDIIADILNRNGIVTLHSTVLHDQDSYKDSYSRSAQTIQSYLKQYPSIRLVIDVHRDSIMTSADKLVRPVTVVDGEAVAQVMCVVGSNAAGAAYDGWQSNLALAVGLRSALNAEYGDLCRPVYIKRSAYNQQYAPSSLLLEIGSSGNSLSEAQRAAALVAETIVDMMKGDSQ